MLTYAVTNLGAFAIVTLLGQKNDRRTEFEDYNGIGFKSPVLAFALSLFMLSLFGLPLTAGFMGKVLVFRPAIQAANPMLTLLVVVAVINTAISAYYYLRFIVVMFFTRTNHRMDRSEDPGEHRRGSGGDGLCRAIPRHLQRPRDRSFQVCAAGPSSCRNDRAARRSDKNRNCPDTLSFRKFHALKICKIPLF